MKKRICAIFISLIFILGGNAFATEGERIKFGNAQISTDSGITTVTLPLLTKPAGKSVVLVAAYIHQETGRILSVNAAPFDDVSLIAENYINIGVENKEEEGGKLSYYVWDSLGNEITLLNNPPATPLDLEDSTTISQSHLTWSSPDDDYDLSEDLTYNIYQNGMLLKENSSQKEYTVQNLAWGSDYSFEVCAVDKEGAQSNAKTVSVTTPYKNTVQTTNAVIPSPDGNLEFTGSETANTRYFYCEKAEAGGLPCYKTALRTQDSAGTYLMYKFADKYFSELSGVKKFACELTYFDEGTDKITVDWYCLRNGASQIAYERTFVIKTNTMTWKTIRKTFTLENTEEFAKNTDEGSGYFNFRLKSSDKNVGLKARAFSVFPIYEDGRENEYDAVIKKNAGAYLAADKATVSCDVESNAEGVIPTEMDGRSGIALSALGENFTFRVTDAALQSGNIKGYVTYYAPEAGTNITLGAETKSVTASGKWQMMCFDISDIGSGTNAITADNDVYINSVRIVASD